MGTARDRDVLIAGDGARLPQRRFESVGHEVERRATLHRERFARVMGEDKDRHVVRRVVAPPAGPAFVPGAAAATEHLAPHDVGADIREEIADNGRVWRVGTALLALLLAPARRFEHPLTEAHPAFPNRVLQALVRPGDKTVE